MMHGYMEKKDQVRQHPAANIHGNQPQEQKTTEINNEVPVTPNQTTPP